MKLGERARRLMFPLRIISDFSGVGVACLLSGCGSFFPSSGPNSLAIDLAVAEVGVQYWPVTLTPGVVKICPSTGRSLYRQRLGISVRPRSNSALATSSMCRCSRQPLAACLSPSRQE
jgi:hypothetical protein